MTLLEAAIGVTLCIVVLAVACWVMWLDYRRREHLDEQPDAGLSIFDPHPDVHIARSPLAGPRHSCDAYATLRPGYQPQHQAVGPRPADRSPLVHTATVQWDGPTTEAFRRIVGLDPDVPVLREVVRVEGDPQDRWAQLALAARGRGIEWIEA